MSTAEVLDSTFTIYRHGFGAFLLVGCLPEAISSLMTILVEAGRGGLWAALLVLLLVLLGLPAYLLTYAISQGAVVLITSNLFHGRPLDGVGAWAAASKHMWRLLRVELLMWVRLIFAGLLFAFGLMGVARSGNSAQIVFGSIVLLSGVGLAAYQTARYAVAIPIAALEGVNASLAIERSIEMTKPQVKKVFLLNLLFASIVLAIAFGTLSVEELISSLLFAGESFTRTLVAEMVSFVTSIVVAPIYGIGLALVYFDLRIRHEAYDIEVLSRVEQPAQQLEEVRNL